jgi:hypothetical protein
VLVAASSHLHFACKVTRVYGSFESGFWKIQVPCVASSISSGQHLLLSPNSCRLAPRPCIQALTHLPVIPRTAPGATPATIPPVISTPPYHLTSQAPRRPKTCLTRGVGQSETRWRACKGYMYAILRYMVLWAEGNPANANRIDPEQCLTLSTRANF